MSAGRKDSESKPPKQETIFDVLKRILPKSEHWRIESIKIIRSSDAPISSYAVTRSLNESGLKTSISSVHEFFNILVESGLCYRNPEWVKVGRKYVGITDKGKEFLGVLKLKLSSGTANDQ